MIQYIIFTIYVFRFGSLDRRHTSRSISSKNNKNVDQEQPTVSTTRYTNPQHSTTSVLLPNQMYPENSLMRTHSLGNIKNENQQQLEKRSTELDQVSIVSENRKHSEKKWLETSLDSSSVDSGPTLTPELPPPPPPPPIKMTTPPLPPPESKHSLLFEPITNHFDTVIIFFYKI